MRGFFVGLAAALPAALPGAPSKLAPFPEEWMSPYTNVLLYNMRALRADDALQEVFRQVITKHGRDERTAPVSENATPSLGNSSVRASFCRRRLAKVHATGCIFANRWGDLPLWGAVRQLLGWPSVRLGSKFAYYHGSHWRIVPGGGRNRKHPYQGDSWLQAHRAEAEAQGITVE